jgi:hypothetical protein
LTLACHQEAPRSSKGASIDEGLKQAADEVKALAPKCKDSVAAA